MNDKTRTISRLLAILGSTLLLSGCVVSRMESYSDPGMKPQRYHRIAVAFQGEDLINRNRVERLFTEALAKEMRGAELLPAFGLVRTAGYRRFSDRLEELARQGFDACLALDLTEREIRYDEGPLVMLFDEPVALSVDDTREFMAFNLDLIDVQSGERVWTATCHLSRSQLASFRKVMRSLARRTAGGLRQAGLAT